MKYLLEKYSYCDTFSLTGPIEYSKEITIRELNDGVKKAYDELERSLGEFLKKPYNEWEIEERERDGNRKRIYFPRLYDLTNKKDRDVCAAYAVLYENNVISVLKQRANKPLIPETDLWGAYADLLDYCLSVTFTDSWSLTHQPQSKHRHYVIALNEHTKKWLIENEELFDGENLLQDLCLYKGGKMRYASVTHEGIYKEFP